MQANEKRRLLENIDILVRKPAAAGETTMAEVLADLGALYSELCGEPVLIVPTIVHPTNQAAQDKFNQTVQGTNPEQQGKNNE